LGFEECLKNFSGCHLHFLWMKIPRRPLNHDAGAVTLSRPVEGLDALRLWANFCAFEEQRIQCKA
jgi:hypothetical protein